jgi:mannitol-specific phosphotransferase system IIBC component
MQKYNHIKALFFLGIFSLLMLHQFIPHLHHQHVNEYSQKTFVCSEGHIYQHDKSENLNSKKGLLNLLLKIHEHSVASNEILVTNESGINKLNVQKNINTHFSVNNYCSSKTYDEIKQEVVHYSSDNYLIHYLTSLDSRGPPTC